MELQLRFRRSGGKRMAQLDVREAAREITHLNSPDNPVVEHLQRQLSNALVLFLNYKHYHWRISGPLFRDLHKLFDEFSEELEESLDELAERLRMIGQTPAVLYQELPQRASVEPTHAEGNVREMIEEADRNAIRIIREMREAVHAAEKEDDPGSVDLFSQTVRMHEKHEWYLREILKSPDGLVRT
jgi:starvation-inducible DNA-binding protein